jgi:hypothetical protein
LCGVRGDLVHAGRCEPIVGQHRGVPSTLPTHPLAVLPLKLWKPRWFDGVALAVGACAPDLAYPLDGIGVRIPSHTVAALFWWCLPSTIAVGWLIRLGAPVVAAHLPGWLREYGVLGRSRPAWPVTASSALIGAVSHLLWDLVTHPGPVAAWWPIRQACDDSSLILMPLFLWYVGSRHLVRQWHGEPPPVARRPALFWTVSAAVTGAGGSVTLLLADPGRVHVLGTRLIAAVAAGLLAGAWVVQSANVLRNGAALAAPIPPG